MPMVRGKIKSVLKELTLLPNIGSTQKKILTLLEQKVYWHPYTLKPRISLIAKELKINHSVVSRALYGRKNGENGVIGIFKRFQNLPHNLPPNLPQQTLRVEERE